MSYDPVGIYVYAYASHFFTYLLLKKQLHLKVTSSIGIYPEFRALVELEIDLTNLEAHIVKQSRDSDLKPMYCS